MPIVIGYATRQEIKDLRNRYEVFLLRHDQSKGLGILPVRCKDRLCATFIPMSKYESLNPENWENVYIIDERNKEEQLKLGL